MEIADVVPQDTDVLLRRHLLRLDRDSPVADAKLIAFANLNPTASKRAVLPTEDWCEEVGGTDVARYDPDADAVVYAIDEIDQSTGEPESVAVAIGASTASVGHQIGGDSYTGHPSTAAAPQSAFDDAADGELSGNGSLGPAEVDAALATPIGRRPVTVTFAAGTDAAAATALLERHRDADPVREARRKRRNSLRWLADAPLPDGAPASVVRLSRRALISLRQAIDESSGERGEAVAIVASLSTQSPYFLDWIRDGAFFNEALDMIGKPSLVARHNYFNVQTQKKASEGAPPGTPLTTCFQQTPSGTWFMTAYANTVDAGLIPWEIDEVGYGLWGFWRHYELERAAGREQPARAYLERVYPAIRRSAEFLIGFRDPETGLTPPTACEDDNPEPPASSGSRIPTMHASGPVLLAMRSATQAAEVLGREGDVIRYRERTRELAEAIDREYAAGPDGQAWTEDFGDGGWNLWPVRVQPYEHPRSIAQAEAAWQSVKPAFDAPEGPRTSGQYEAKALLGLAHHYNAVNPERLDRVRRGLRWIAGVQAATRDTGILGESWTVRDGELLTFVSQPHVWEQIYFYLAALEAYGRKDYEAAPRGDLLQPAADDSSSGDEGQTGGNKDSTDEGGAGSPGEGDDSPTDAERGVAGEADAGERSFGDALPFTGAMLLPLAGLGLALLAVGLIARRPHG